MKKVLSTLILGLLALTAFAKDKLIVAPAPMGIELKHDFEVKARIHDGEWQDVSTYAFKVDRVANAKHNVEITSVAKFEFEGTSRATRSDRTPTASRRSKRVIR